MRAWSLFLALALLLARADKQRRMLLVVLTCSRPNSLRTLWLSIQAALPAPLSVRILVHIDHLQSVQRSAFSLVELNRSAHGSVEVVLHNKTQGIRGSYLSLWQYMMDEDFIMFLEDDVSISRHALRYSELVMRRHFAQSWERRHGQLCGFSLYNIQFNEVTNAFLPKSPEVVERGLYYFQQPQSWGAVYTAACWQNFSRYANELVRKGINPLVPHSMTNRWRDSRSWKKYLFRYLYDKGAYLLYPALRRRVSFSQNRLEMGANDRLTTGSSQRKVMLERMWVELASEQVVEEYLGRALREDAGPLQTFDVYHARVDGPAALVNASRSLPSSLFTRCTLVVRHTAPGNKTSALLSWLAQLRVEALMEVLVLVQANDSAIRLPRSLNNRASTRVSAVAVSEPFSLAALHPLLKTECVAYVDGALLRGGVAGTDDITYSLMLWQNTFYDYMVGTTSAGRSHVSREGAPPKWGYQRPQSRDRDAFHSLLLPLGAVFSRKHLLALRPLVSALPDPGDCCEWLLLNMIVANATLAGPVTHLPNRAYQVAEGAAYESCASACLSWAASLFDEMPLQYTTSTFKWYPRGKVTPNFDRFRFQRAYPRTD